MKRKKTLAVTFFLIVFLIGVCISIFHVKNGETFDNESFHNILDEGTAKKYASILSEKYYPELDLGDYKINSDYNKVEKIWIVYYSKKSFFGNIEGGGGPAFYFKENGEVLKYNLQK